MTGRMPLQQEAMVGNIKLIITQDSKQGGRKYMEDVLQVETSENEVFLGVYDGHGGEHAAQFVRQHLYAEMQRQRHYTSDHPPAVLRAIRQAFISTHRAMYNAFGAWPKTSSGYPNTSGTTVSIVVLRSGRAYCANVGDSGIVLGVRKKTANRILPHCITVDHKPESPKELKRIRACGGDVVAKAGVNRVVWNRPRHNSQRVLRSTEVDHIPFLAVARALGDMWSYNSHRDVFVVSPEPDVCTFELDIMRQDCLVMASDGLWNMVSPSDCMKIVHGVNLDNRNLEDDVGATNPASALVNCSLDRWKRRMLRADNTSVISVFLSEIWLPRGCKPPVLNNSPNEVEGVVLDDLSDSELIDNFLPEVEIEGCADQDLVALPCHGGVGLSRTPPTEFNGPTHQFGLRKCTTPHPKPKKHRVLIARPRNINSAPSNLLARQHASQFRGICHSSPFARSRFANKFSTKHSIHNGHASPSFMEPQIKKTNEHHVGSRSNGSSNNGLQGVFRLTKTLDNEGASPSLITTSESKTSINYSTESPLNCMIKNDNNFNTRTLRPKSPRLIGENLLPSKNKSTDNVASNKVCSSPGVPGMNFEPRQATSAKSPLKIDAMETSPATGFNLAALPRNLERCMDAESAENIVPELAVGSDCESTANLQLSIAKKLALASKKLILSPISQCHVKRLQNKPSKNSMSPDKSVYMRTRRQSKLSSKRTSIVTRRSLAPQKSHS